MAAARRQICAQACFLDGFSSGEAGEQILGAWHFLHGGSGTPSLLTTPSDGRRLVAATPAVWNAPIPNIAGVD